MCRDVGPEPETESTTSGESESEEEEGEEGERLTLAREVHRIECASRRVHAPLNLKMRVAKLKCLRQAAAVAKKALTSHASKGKGTYAQLRKQRERLARKEEEAREKVSRAERDLIMRAPT